jgi:hypothetical protein
VRSRLQPPGIACYLGQPLVLMRRYGRQGSSISGLLTRVEIGHIRIRSAGRGRIRSRGVGFLAKRARVVTRRQNNGQDCPHLGRLVRDHASERARGGGLRAPSQHQIHARGNAPGWIWASASFSLVGSATYCLPIERTAMTRTHFAEGQVPLQRGRTGGKCFSPAQRYRRHTPGI